MEASPVHIIQYFDGSKQGIIPLFQRPYSWEPKDWNTLWDDLMAQYEEVDRSSHFMGADYRGVKRRHIYQRSAE